jgi:hypothetical protein
MCLTLSSFTLFTRHGKAQAELDVFPRVELFTLPRLPKFPFSETLDHLGTAHHG